MTVNRKIIDSSFNKQLKFKRQNDYGNDIRFDKIK